MRESEPSASPSRPAPMRVVGGLSLAVGLLALLIPLQHGAASAVSADRNLLWGLLALGAGAWLIRPWLDSNRLASIAAWCVLAISPIVLFFALYATLAELEEVVVLEAVDRDGRPADLRLWIVDADGVSWVTMPRRKATTHGLDDVEVDLLRDGEVECVHVTRIEDRTRVDRIHRLRHEKYAVQRFATAIGLFGRSPDETTVTLRLDPCSSRSPGESGGGSEV